MSSKSSKQMRKCVGCKEKFEITCSNCNMIYCDVCTRKLLQNSYDSSSDESYEECDICSHNAYYCTCCHECERKKCECACDCNREECDC